MQNGRGKKCHEAAILGLGEDLSVTFIKNSPGTPVLLFRRDAFGS
jgi:hypothetical protein